MNGALNRTRLTGLLATAAGTLLSVGAARADDWSLGVSVGGPVVVGEPVDSFVISRTDYLGAFDACGEEQALTFVSFAPSVCRPVIIEPAYCAPLPVYVAPTYCPPAVVYYPAYSYPVYSYSVYTPYYSSYPIVSPYYGAYTYPAYSYSRWGGWYDSGCGDSWWSYGSGWSLSFSFSSGHWSGYGHSGWGWRSSWWDDDCRGDRGWSHGDWHDDHHNGHHDGHGGGGGGHGGGGHSNRSERDPSSPGVLLGAASGASAAQAGFGPAPERPAPAARVVDSRGGGRGAGRPSARPLNAGPGELGVPLNPVKTSSANASSEFGPAPMSTGKPSAVVRGERRPTPRRDQPGTQLAGGVTPGAPDTSIAALPSVKPAAPMASSVGPRPEGVRIGGTTPSLPRGQEPTFGGTNAGLGGVTPAGPRVDLASRGVNPGGVSGLSGQGGVVPGMSRPERGSIGGVTPGFPKPENMKIGGVTPRLIEPPTTISPPMTTTGPSPVVTPGVSPAAAPSIRRPTPRSQPAPSGLSVSSHGFERGWSGGNSKQVGTFQPAMPSGVYDVPAPQNRPAPSASVSGGSMPRVRTSVGQPSGPSVAPAPAAAPADSRGGGSSGSGKRPTPKRK